MSERKTLFLLPGLLCDDFVWQHQVQQLSDLADIRIASFKSLNSFDAMADSVIDAAPEEFYLAGHSMGGRVAMQVLNKAPRRVQKLALLDTAMHPVGANEKEKRQVLIDLAHEQGMAALARTWATPMVHPDRQKDSAFMQDLFAMVERYEAKEFENQVQALLTRPDAEPFLAKAPSGSLVLCGREDSWSPPAQHQDIRRALPDQPEVVIIENCGHMSTMEQPEAVTAAMRRWLMVTDKG